MRTFVLAAAVVALLAVAHSAAAEPPGKPTFHDRGTTTEVDPDFCGTGEAILVEGRFNFVGWVGETGGDEEQVLRGSFSFRNTLTNPETGASVIDSGAGSFTNEIIRGLEAEEHTHLIIDRGLRAKLQLRNGRVLTHDAGLVVFEISFDEDDNVTGVEVVRMSGPHPDFEGGVWCELATEALGIS